MSAQTDDKQEVVLQMGAAFAQALQAAGLPVSPLFAQFMAYAVVHKAELLALPGPGTAGICFANSSTDSPMLLLATIGTLCSRQQLVALLKAQLDVVIDMHEEAGCQCGKCAPLIDARAARQSQSGSKH